MTISVTGSGIASEPRIRQGHLTGPSRPVDRRIHAVRDDLADAALAGCVVAPRYAEGISRQAVAPWTMIRAAPDDGMVAVSQLLFGEAFTVFDVVGGWAWGQCGHDCYVGWIRLAALGDPTVATHRIAAASAAVFAAADIKSRVIRTLPLNARIAATDAEEHFVAAAGGFIHRRHVLPLAAPLGDPSSVALGFVGAPYVWGGRTREGVDCSGLTQAVLAACGIVAPRDSDQQAAAFAAIDPAARCRGDLVSFPGHVGILADADTLIHANAHWMATVVEPLADAAARLAPTGFHRP